MGSLEGKSFESIFVEDPKKAIVGKSKTIFYVHPGALLRGNSALTARLIGPWKNAGQETLDWSAFDEETIDCVLKFCYGLRQCDIPCQPAINSGDSGPQLDLVLARPGTDSDTQPRTPLATRSYTGDAIVLYAKVYLFGYHYLVEDLQSFAVAKMKDCFEPCMKEYSSSPQATSGCLAEAVRIIYESTLSSNANMDAARKALVMFIASFYDTLSGDFAKFHEETGDFMVDLACELVRLLRSCKDDLGNKNSEIHTPKGQTRRRGQSYL